MLSLFIVGLLLLNFPQVQFLFINSQNVFVFINAVIFFLIVLNKKNKESIYRKLKTKRTEVLLILILFIFISLSIVQVIDTYLFFNKYLGLITSILFYINLSFFNKRIHKYGNLVILFWISAHVLNELFLFIAPNYYISIMPNLLINKEYEMVKDEILRNRLTISTYVEIFLPVLYWLYLHTQRKLLKIYLLVLIPLINFLAFFSGWRIRVLICTVSMFQIFYYLFKYRKNKYLLSKVLTLLFIFLLYSFFAMSIFKNNPTISRFIDENKLSMNSNQSRISILYQSFDIFLYKPFFGVGLNNNFIYRDNPAKKTFNIDESASLVREAGSHNTYIDLLIDTGLLGLSPFLLLFFYWFRKDFIIEGRKNRHFILVFYLLLFYALFHSVGGYRFLSILFLLRILIDNSLNYSKELQKSSKLRNFY